MKAGVWTKARQRMVDARLNAQRWWAGRVLRERLLLLAAGVAALLLLADAALNMPLERRLKGLHGQVVAQQAQLDALNKGTAERTGAQALREHAARLQQRVAAAQAQVDKMRTQAAASARLPEALRAITGTVGSVRLLALELSGDAAGAAAAQAPGAAASGPLASGRLYRLPITLKVSGGFDELQLLLTEIERHAPSMQWSQLVLDSSGWPAVQLTLKAHVLSPESRWGAAP